MDSMLVDAEPVTASRIPFHPELTQADMAQASEYRRDYERRQADERAAHKRERAETINAMTDRMVRILGSDIAFDLHQFKRSVQQRDAAHQLEQGLFDPAELAARRAKELSKFLREHGFDSPPFDQYPHDLKDVFKPFPLPDFTGTVKPTGHGGSTPAPPETSHFWPPFSGWQWGHDGAGMGFRVNVTHLLNSTTGEVGHIITLDDSDASDLDAGVMQADSQIAFFYRVPRTGLVEVTINAFCQRANHALRVDDEWGTSWSRVSQTASFMSHVVYPTVGVPTYSWLSDLQHNKDTSTHRNEDRFWPGQPVRSDPMVSAGPVPAGTLVEVRAGLHSIDDAVTNDMTVHSKSHHSWSITQVDVRVLP